MTGDGLVLAVWTPGVDTLVRLERERGDTVFNAPPSRYGPELVFLEAEEGLSGLCVEPVFNVSTPFDVRVEVLGEGAYNRTELDGLRLASHAAELWQTGTENHQLEAIAQYAEAARALPPELASISLYYAAQGAANLYRMKEAAEFLDRIGDVPADSFLSYAVPWLRAETFMLNEESMSRPREMVETAILAAGHDFPAALPPMLVLQSETYIADDQLDVGEQILGRALGLSSNDPRSRSQIYNNLGYVEIRRSYQVSDREQKRFHLERSAALHLKAKNFAINAADYQMAGLVFNNLGWLYEQLGDLFNAQHYLRRSLDAVYGRTSNRSDSLIYANLGRIYLRLGDVLKAEKFLERAIDASEGGESSRLPAIRCELGSVYREQGRLDDATALHAGCLAAAIEEIERDHYAAASSYKQAVSASIELAIDSLSGGQEAAAQQHLATAASYLEEAGSRKVQRLELDRLEALLNSYRFLVEMKLGNRQVADRYLDRLPAWEKMPDPTTRVEAMAAVFRGWLATGQQGAALSLGSELLDEVESLYAILETERLGPSWANRTHWIYDEMISLLYARYSDSAGGNAALLFEAVERSRAPNLRKTLAAHAAGQFEQNFDRLSEIGRLSNELAEEFSADTSLARYRAHDAYLAREPDSPTGSLPVTASLAAVQSALGDEEQLVYFVLNSRPFVLSVSREQVQVYELDEALDVAGLTGKLYSSIHRKSVNLRSMRAELEVLLPRAMPLSPRIYFVLHKELHHLPVGLLSRDGRYLADERELVVVPSASALIQSGAGRDAGRRPPGLDLAVLADPVFDPGTGGGLPGPADAERSWSSTLERLPWTAAEAEQLAQRLKKKSVLTFTGMQANRRNLFREDVRGARVLHVASHGYFAGDSADNVGFVLSPDSREGESAFVTLTEIRSEHFSNEVVVISGCETARGQRLEGEGSMSIARAFLGQGARHVVATLWPVSDRASSVFMDLFYEELVKHSNVSLALGMAQSRMRSMVRYSQPYYWASYTLTSVAGPELLDPL